MDDTATPKTVMVTITPRLNSEANVTIALNGHSQSIPTGVPTPVREDMLEVLDNSDLSYTIDRHESAAGDGAEGEGAVAGAGSLAASPGQDAGPATRSGPDDDHSKAGQVDKERAPGGYAPAAGAAGADDQIDEAANTGVPKGDLTADADDVAVTGKFDAEATIKGTLDEVKARLADLTPAQRKKVLAAENDREQPRKGVLDALAD